MRKVMLLAAAVAALPYPAIAADEELAGTYRLISSTRKILDTGEVLNTWGKNPKGFITYGKDSRVLVLIVRDDRPRPESVEKMTDQQRIDLFRSMTAYGGTYMFDGKRVEHHIDISWNEVWTGTTVVREIAKEGDKLIYTSPAAPFSSDGKMSVVTLVWEKMK
jgi:Lipocalin-like domain